MDTPKLLRLLTSRKFLALVLSVLTSFGLDVSPDVQAGLIALVSIIYMVATAWEDAAFHKGFAPPANLTVNLSEEVSEDPYEDDELFGGV